MAEPKITLILSLEEARAYHRIAGRTLDFRTRLREALEQEGEDTIDAADAAHDKLREALELAERGEDD